MGKQIRAAIVGYGNLGKSAEAVIAEQPDFDFVGVFSRRDATALDTTSPVFPVDSIADFRDRIDVLLLCLGSATDMPSQGPEFAKLFTTADTYDNHALIPEHRERMDAAARSGDNLALISTGWDPGLFSINRVMGEALFHRATQNTFWGPGLSQGHSDAIRRIAGVRAGVQYTVPKEDAIAAARRGLTQNGKQAHLRQCYVVADVEDHDRIRDEIVNMPDYFVGYETTVTFVSEAEFAQKHQGMPHGGRVITSGELGADHTQHTVEYSLELDRNPDFTAAALVAYARAAVRMRRDGVVGAVTPFEVAPYLLSPTPLDELVSNRL